MARKQSRWDLIEPAANKIEIDARSISIPSSAPQMQGEEYMVDSQEVSVSPQVQSPRRSFRGWLSTTIRNARFWPTLKAVVLLCVCIVVLIVGVNLVVFLLSSPLGHLICTIMGFLVVFGGFLLMRKQGFMS